MAGVVCFSLFLCLLFATTTVVVNAQTPSQIHILYGGNNNEYVVSWVNIQTNGTRKSYVEYGVDANSLTMVATGVPRVFTEDRCNSDRIMHDVSLSPIKPNTRVYYRVSSGPGTPVSATFDFVAIDRDDASRPLTISLVGDMGVQPHISVSSIGILSADAKAHKHDLFLHYGDIAYNMDDSCNSVGDDYMNGAQSIGAYTPYIYGPGNHETDKNYSYHTFLNRFLGQQALAKASGSPSVRYLSFDVQLVHVVMFDTDAWIYPLVFDLATPQLTWMKQDLAKVNRTKTPWIIVAGHRSMYCTKSTDAECNSEAEHIRNGYPLVSAGVEPLLLEYGVDLYIGGHTHHYMRTWPVKQNAATQKNYVNPAGVVHVQSGIGGVDGEDAFSIAMRPIDAYRDEQYYRSFSTILVHNSTHLTFSQKKAADGTVFDMFDIVQSKHGQF